MTSEQDFSAVIEESRAVGREILQLTPADLQAGAELHADALVIEPYGLGVYAPQDWDRLRASKEAGASAAELTDLVEEHGMLGHLRDENARRLYQLAWQAAGVDCVFQGAGEEGNLPERMIKRLARYTHLIDAMPDFLARTGMAEDIEKNRARGLRSLCFGTNGVPLAGTRSSVETELAPIRVFAQLGVRIMHLTYNRRNPLGDGCGEINDGGLSAFGHDAIAEMNSMGIIVDLAHAGFRTCREAARASVHPVVASHTAAHALNPHIRCKPDDVIREIVGRGGVIAVTNVPSFLGGSGDLSAMLDHIGYLVRKFGADHVAIGTDRVCSIPSTVSADPNARLKARAAWEGLWPSGFPSHDPQWNQPRQIRSMAWTNWPLFTAGLLRRGHSEADVRKIVGGNVLRVASAVWKTPAALR